MGRVFYAKYSNLVSSRIGSLPQWIERMGLLTPKCQQYEWADEDDEIEKMMEQEVALFPDIPAKMIGIELEEHHTIWPLQ